MRPLPQILVVACAVLLVACESADLPLGMPTSPTTDRSEDGPTVNPTSIVKAVAAPTPTPLRATARVADQLRRYLDRVLGGPSQTAGIHRHIRQVSVGLHVATIHTDLSSHVLDRAVGERICHIASRFRQNPEGRHVTALDIEVYGSSGDLIASYRDLPDLASASSSSRMPVQVPAVTRPMGGAPSPTTGRPVLERRR